MTGLIRNNSSILIFYLTFIIAVQINAQSGKQLPVYMDEYWRIRYTSDEKGNRIPDFSYCGYKNGEIDIPDVPVKIIIPNTSEDATAILQGAIDHVSGLPLDENGFRGTILLEKGVYRIKGRLNINSSGVVLRGSGMGENGTILIAAGTNRETLLKIQGKLDVTLETPNQILQSYVPVGGNHLRLASDHSLLTGDQVVVYRPTTQEWIDEIGMTSFGGTTHWLDWQPGADNILWDRTITAVDSQYITIDIPITTAIDAAFGGGSVIKYSWPGRISNIGIENLNLQSEYNVRNLKDEDHCWMAITFENTMDCWVRQVTFESFAGSAVAIYETAKQITVEDCISTNPVSEIGGQRRYTFFTSGQQTLFQRCYAEEGYHDFVVGNFAPGPNAFVQCESYLPYNYSGTIDRWASGVLYDLVNIDGRALSLKNCMQNARGAGWTAANCVIWQSSASLIECYSPPTATNWAFGVWGQFAGNGNWYETSSYIKPRSLYYAQLSDRIGSQAIDNAYFLPTEYGSTTSPSEDLVRELSNDSQKPMIQLKDWILAASNRNPVISDTSNLLTTYRFEERMKDTTPEKNIEIHNGWLVINDSVITGQTRGVQWWRGTSRPYGASHARPHITRYVPGRTGLGYTDDLDEVTDWMLQNNILAIDHNYGLWYDRRRDDHERTRRIDGDVWPPFYELPFARSGQGIAWDGLSKYDLTAPNQWYWKRLKDFADLADQNGRLLIHQNYFQHNILEAGAHWADFPWRTANNINRTGFPEPPPYAGNKRIFMANQFYDISNPVRRELHKQYIRQCLSNFSDNSNVIQLTSAEYTGPLHFVEFWIDVIGDWEMETGYDALIGLSATKDVQDSILSDSVRSRAIEIIDIRYWHYRDDNSLYAPEGGKSLAPRQHARLVDPGKASFRSVYKAVSEYRTKYPEKVVIYSNPIGKRYSWAVFMGGGSLTTIPEIEVGEFYKAASTMIPVASKTDNTFILANPQGEQIIYCMADSLVTVNLKNFKGSYNPVWIQPETGSLIKLEKKIRGGRMHELIPPIEGDIILWIWKN